MEKAPKFLRFFSISSVDLIITHVTAVYTYILGPDVLIIM